MWKNIRTEIRITESAINKNNTFVAFGRTTNQPIALILFSKKVVTSKKGVIKRSCEPETINQMKRTATLVLFCLFFSATCTTFLKQKETMKSIDNKLEIAKTNLMQMRQHVFSDEIDELISKILTILFSFPEGAEELDSFERWD